MSASNASNLIQLIRELNLKWQDTRTYWRDMKAQEFEQKYIEALPGHVERAAKVMGEIELLLKKVRSDCE